MSYLWDNKKQGAIEREKAATRLDCFLSVVYMFPNCLELDDMNILAKREEDLSKIYKFSAQAFFATYMVIFAGHSLFRKGSMPYMRDFAKHGILSIAGTFASAEMADKIAAEGYYNTVLMQLVEKYNFTPEEVMDLQRNLNQYYIQKDRESDLKRL